MRQELRSLADKVAKSEVRKLKSIHGSISELTRPKWRWQAEHAEAERRLQEERATLTRFDAELRDLDEVIKAKKQVAADAEVAIKKLEHDMQSLAKEKASHVTAVTNLEKQYEWIEEESP